MREAAFIQRNKPRWEEFEKVVSNPSVASPDRLAELFIQVTDDLSFSRTQYPDSRTTQYLNALATQIHLEIYRNKREETSRFITFWRDELPLVFYEARRPMLYAFVIFVLTVLIGVVSTRYDETFVRLILGDDYVNMTLENIRNGNPTKVYASRDEANMFFMIAWNNIMVSFRIFITGIFFSFGTGGLLAYNGVMVGTFMTFMYNESQFSEAFPVIMLHGTIELTSIILSAAAGFTMGNSLLFPGTYSRFESFRLGAKKGLKMVVGLVPFFIIAAAIESIITRYASMHWGLKLLIILISAALMVYYFIIYPSQLTHGRIQTDRVSKDT
ncbi:MAG: stage II sporulation protein M [Bacteroidetes bacterium]|nr:stage II sporulation protein M [Bacteroidota bacterium]